MSKHRQLVLSITSNLFHRALFVSVLSLVAVNQVSAQTKENILEFQHVVYGSTRGELFQNPGGITYERNRQEIYVADRGNNSISMFDVNGRHLFTFPCRVISPRSGREVSTEPKSIVVNQDGNIYFTDTISQSIQVCNYRGETLSTIPVIEKLGLSKRKTAPEYLFRDESGFLYVTVGGDISEVVILDSDQEIVKRFAGTGDGFSALTGIWVDNSGKIYVTDAMTVPCVQVYDRDGNYIFGFGEKELGDANFSQPRGVITTSNGDIWVIDSVRQVLKRFDKNGEFIEMLGGHGFGIGDFRYPVGISGDGKDKLFILERAGTRYQYFKVREAAEFEE